MTDEERKRFEGLNRKLDGLQAEMTLRFDQLQSELNRLSDSVGHRSTATQSELREGLRAIHTRIDRLPGTN